MAAPQPTAPLPPQSQPLSALNASIDNIREAKVDVPFSFRRTVIGMGNVH